MLDLSLLFSCEWLIDYSRDFGAPFATYLDGFDEWVTLYKCPGCLPDAWYLLYQMGAVLLSVAGAKWATIKLSILSQYRPITASRHRAKDVLLGQDSGYGYKAAKEQVMRFVNDVRKGVDR
jgi:hypothetical protein